MDDSEKAPRSNNDENVYLDCLDLSIRSFGNVSTGQSHIIVDRANAFFDALKSKTE